MEQKQQAANGFTRQIVTPKGMQKDIKHDLQQYALRKENEQTTMRVFSPLSCKDSFRIIMVLMAYYDLELHQMDVKTAFRNGDLYEKFTWHNPKLLSWKKKNVWYAACRNSFMG